MNKRDSLGARIRFWIEKNIPFYQLMREKRHTLRYEKYFKDRREAIHKVCGKKNIIVLSNDCLSGLVQTDLGLPVYSPLINVSMNAKYFVKLCSNIEYYFAAEPEAYIDKEQNYPILQVDDIKIFCPHYKTEDEALHQWKRGCKKYRKAIKSDYEMCVIMTERFEFTDDCFKLYERLPFKHKILFTKKDTGLKDCFCIKGKNNRKELDWITGYTVPLGFSRYYDQFDFTSWFLEIYNS